MSQIPWTEEPGGLQSVGSQRLRRDLAAKQQQRNYNSQDTVSNSSLLLNCDLPGIRFLVPSMVPGIEELDATWQ